MHTFDADDDISFHHNGDFSGDVTISLPTQAAATELWNDGHTTIKVPYAALEALVAERYRRAMVGALEEASAKNVLSGGWVEDLDAELRRGA